MANCEEGERRNQGQAKEKGVYLEVQGDIGGAGHVDELVTRIDAIASPAGVSVCQAWGTEERV
jgi:hypothetical protein